MYTQLQEIANLNAHPGLAPSQIIPAIPPTIFLIAPSYFESHLV